MNLTVLASGSVANSYLIHDENEVLIIEAGVKLARVKEALDFDLSHIVGCLVSHMHGDHSKYMKEYADAGITVIANDSLIWTHSHHNIKPISDGRGVKMGNFKVLPLPVNHDVTCHAFLIDHPDTGKILFMTDSFMCEYVLPDLSHILIESNYADDILEANILKGSLHPSMRPRLLGTHMELNTCKKILCDTDLSKVINIVLLHLSSGNSDEQRFVREITQATGKQVFAAAPGLTINLNSNPY